jgi:hypothetical protein
VFRNVAPTQQVPIIRVLRANPDTKRRLGTGGRGHYSEGIEGDDELSGWIQRAIKFVAKLSGK